MTSVSIQTVTTSLQCKDVMDMSAAVDTIEHMILPQRPEDCESIPGTANT